MQPFQQAWQANSLEDRVRPPRDDCDVNTYALWNPQPFPDAIFAMSASWRRGDRRAAELRPSGERQ